MRKTNLIFGSELQELISQVNTIYQDETKLIEIITKLSEQTKTYASSFGALKKKGRKK